MANMKICGFEHSCEENSYIITSRVYLSIVDVYIPSHVKSRFFYGNHKKLTLHWLISELKYDANPIGLQEFNIFIIPYNDK